MTMQGFTFAYDPNEPSGLFDGIAPMHPLLSSMLFKMFDPRKIEFGTSQYPLNLYDQDTPVAEIGGIIQKEQ